MTTTLTSPSEEQHHASDIQARALEVSSLSSIFSFFSRCIEEEVDENFISLLRGDLREPLQELGIELNDEFFDGSVDSLIETLAEEYTGLFVAPGCISPYASVFETGCMFKEPADRAIAAYHDAGWDYKTRHSGEFPDHIGTMLGFYGILCTTEFDCLQNRDISKADELANQRKHFLIEQLATWGPGWCHLACQAANEPFYQNVLQLIEQMLWSEISQFVDRRQLREFAKLNKREPKRMDYDADFRKASGL